MSGPQFITVHTPNLDLLINCAISTSSASMPAPYVVPAIMPISLFPFVTYSFPICVDPPPDYYLALVSEDDLPRIFIDGTTTSGSECRGTNTAGNSTAGNVQASGCTARFNFTAERLQCIVVSSTSSLSSSSSSVNRLMVVVLDYTFNSVISESVVQEWLQQTNNVPINIVVRNKEQNEQVAGKWRKFNAL